MILENFLYKVRPFYMLLEYEMLLHCKYRSFWQMNLDDDGVDYRNQIPIWKKKQKWIETKKSMRHFFFIFRVENYC